MHKSGVWVLERGRGRLETDKARRGAEKGKQLREGGREGRGTMKDPRRGGRAGDIGWGVKRENKTETNGNKRKTWDTEKREGRAEEGGQVE